MVEAIKSYKIAFEIAKVKLGEFHALTVTISDSMHKAEEKEKFQKSSALLRRFIRNEKATVNIFKAQNLNIMYKPAPLYLNDFGTKQVSPSSIIIPKSSHTSARYSSVKNRFSSSSNH